MKLVIGLVFSATVMFFVFVEICSRVFTVGIKALIVPTTVIVLIVSISILYKFGVFDDFIWDISMPIFPNDEKSYIHSARIFIDRTATDGPSSCVAPISGWIGKVDYSLGFGGKRAIAIRIDSHMILRSVYLPADAAGKDAFIPEDQFKDVEAGQFVHVAGSFPASVTCPRGASQLRLTQEGDLEALFKFSSVQQF